MINRPNTDVLGLSKRKREWRDKTYKECEYAALEEGQIFPKGKKIIVLYPSNKKAKGGFNDAEWVQRVEVHHLQEKGCAAYWSDRWHDGFRLSEGWPRCAMPKVHTVKIQRDGATQLVVWDAFRATNYQEMELIGVDEGELNG